jgi:hypothetical protein
VNDLIYRGWILWDHGKDFIPAEERWSAVKRFTGNELVSMRASTDTKLMDMIDKKRKDERTEF